MTRLRPNSRNHPPHDLRNLTLGDVEAAGFTTAVLPIGATEPHNYHLPYGTDIFQVDHIALEASRLANARGGRCVCLPHLPFGYEGNMRGFPLAINLQPTTIITVIRDVARSLVESHIDFLFILNGHGGNELKTIIRELYRDNDIFICGANWWECVPDAVANFTPGGGDHANAMETATCLHLVPELVRMTEAADGRMTEPMIPEFSEGWVRYSRFWKAFAPSSGAGDPRAATADGGKKLLEAAISKISDFLLKLSASRRTPEFPFHPIDSKT